jgi:hypothetical protein
MPKGIGFIAVSVLVFSVDKGYGLERKGQIDI